MADKDKAADVPTPEPVTSPDEHGLPEPQRADNHRHNWQGMRQAGRQLETCALCGKERDRE